MKTDFREWTKLNGAALVAVVLFIGSIIFIRLFPDSYRDGIGVLATIIVSYSFYFIGEKNSQRKSKEEMLQIERNALQKWIPQAESVIDKLITMQSNVNTIIEKCDCKNMTSHLPELNDDSNRIIRITIQEDCRHRVDALINISYQLEDAVKDWQRFISDNCLDGECEVIIENINRQRRNRGVSDPDELA